MATYRIENNETEDSVLWIQLREGDEEAFSLLFKKYYPTLVSYGKTLLDTPYLVNDCVQDVFVDLWTYRSSINEFASAKIYLISSVRRRIANLYKKEKHLRDQKDIDSVKSLFDFSIEDQIIVDDEMYNKVEKLNVLINSLPPRQKEALCLRYHHGLSIEEVSKILDMNYQSAKNLIHRAILLLRKEWSESLPLLIPLCFYLN